MPVLSPVAESVAQKRYYFKDQNGKPIEDWEGLSQRVVNYVCRNEGEEFKKEIFDLIYSTKFLPNSPCLVNSGRNGKSRGLLACFVTKGPADCWHSDDIDTPGIIENVANFGHIARQGGGAGVSFSKIRPEGDPVFGSTHARACGPIECMRMVSEVMSSITQSGFRGMACMGVLMADHPDIFNFVVCKQRQRALRSFLKEDIHGHYDQLNGKTHHHLNIVLDKFISNFNISVCASDAFMKAVEDDGDWDLQFDGKIYKTIKAKELFDLIIQNAWQNGDPGLLFYNRMNSGPYALSKQKIDATNPCGEQVLPEWGSCNLGSIDVSKFFNDTREEINWKDLAAAIHAAVQFLDDVIDVNEFPTPQFAKWAKENRPVGLGIMGFADLLLKKKLAYGSEESMEFADKLSAFFKKEAHKKSVQLGKERGTPKQCKFDEIEHRRNVTTISIAPTGSIAMLAGCSHAIEPLYSETVYRYDNTGEHKMGTHPDANKPYFRCAITKDPSHEVRWEEHVDMQAAFQKHCDSAISKTINMPNSASIEDIASAYMRAWKEGCKGITVYRDGCKTTQVLMTDEKSSTVSDARPDEVECEIFKARAEGIDWHIIIGKVEGHPYELFAVNGRVDLPRSGVIVKKKRRHYVLFDENKKETLIDNLVEEESHIHPKVSLETRRFSMELRNGIDPKEIVEQIDKSNETIVSFSKVVSRIFKKSHFVDGVTTDVTCPECASRGIHSDMICEAGCWRCENCHYARCG